MLAAATTQARSGKWEMAPRDFVEAPSGESWSPSTSTPAAQASGFPMELDYWQVIAMRDRKIHRVDNYLTRARAVQACGLE
jgi:hypothetical protein